jgi:acyl carrier protein
MYEKIYGEIEQIIIRNVETDLEIDLEKEGIKISPDSKLGIDLEVDSLLFLAIASDIEAKYGIIIKEAKLFRIETIGDLVSLVIKLRTQTSDNLTLDIKGS